MILVMAASSGLGRLEEVGGGDGPTCFGWLERFRRGGEVLRMREVMRGESATCFISRYRVVSKWGVFFPFVPSKTRNVGGWDGSPHA